MIAKMDAGTKPAVRSQGDIIGVWADHDGDQHGFAFDRFQASFVAAELLRETAALSGDDLPVHEAQSLSIDLPQDITRESFVRLVFEISGAPIALALTLDQMADLAAANVAIVRKIDAGFTPRNDLD